VVYGFTHFRLYSYPQQAAEAIRGVERQLEATEKTRREQLQEADDLRKRTRQERLRQLRAAAASMPLQALLGQTSGDDGPSSAGVDELPEHQAER
jgi:hypothetical protein